MKEKSKSLKDIYNEMYDPSEMEHNPLKAVEARGYLKCLKQFLPSESWIEIEDIMLMLVIKTMVGKKWKEAKDE